MAGDDLAEGDVDQVACLVDDGVERVDVADHADDLELLLVERIPGEVARTRKRVLHEPRVVEGADGVRVGNAGRDHFASAGIAGHEVGLDEAGGDLQVGLEETAVEFHRCAAGAGRAEVEAIRVVAREMIFHSDMRQHPRIADQLREFRALVGAMQAGRDENRDGRSGNARGDEVLDHRPQEKMVRHRPGDVADEDAGAPLSARERTQRRGAHRLVKRTANGAGRVGNLGEVRLADDRGPGPVGQPHLQTGLAVGNINRAHRA